MSYTKGPWRYEKSTKTIRSKPENYWLCTMDSWDGAVDHEANACLIAAAPDLLEACKEMLAVLEQIDFSSLPVEYDKCFWADWEAAITKAEGKEG